MASVNKVILVGHLGSDPEMRDAGGSQVASLSVATSERWIDRSSGERKERTEWHRVAFFGRLAEIASGYLQKGALVYIEGRIRTRSWTAQDGTEQRRTEIAGDHLVMLGGGTHEVIPPRVEPESADAQPARARAGAGAGSTDAAAYERASGGRATRRASVARAGLDGMDDDIPF